MPFQIFDTKGNIKQSVYFYTRRDYMIKIILILQENTDVKSLIMEHETNKNVCDSFGMLLFFLNVKIITDCTNVAN